MTMLNINEAGELSTRIVNAAIEHGANASEDTKESVWYLTRNLEAIIRELLATHPSPREALDRVTQRLLTVEFSFLLQAPDQRILRTALERGKVVQWANEIGLRQWFTATAEHIDRLYGQPAILWRIKE